MGIGFSRNLIKKGFTVSGYDIVPALVDRFVQSGGIATSSPKEAAECARILLVIVINHVQVTSLLFQENTGAIHGLPKNSAIVISSTVPGAYYQEVREKLDALGRSDVLLLDCPVSGGASGAADRNLTIFACGTDEGMTPCDSVLRAIGSRICRIKKSDGSNGETGSGANGKVCHQVIPEIAIALVAEVVAFASRAGLKTQEVYDYLQSGEGASWIMKDRIPHALEGDETVYSAMTNSQKDSSIIVRTAAERNGRCRSLATLSIWTAPRRRPSSNKIQSDASSVISLQDIEDIMVGVRLAATAESRAFTQAVELKAEQMFDIVCGVAGWNVQFERCAPQMRKKHWFLREVEESRQIGIKLAKAVAKASRIGASLLIASATVQVSQLQVGPLSEGVGVSRAE
ncbi:hypothetical protein FSARC_5097 [Fusarium sarcochroum]|uniref:3-hydroxyisobutyrate dehydrogenase n=1 Tax=Fusarium sarcochroum TaxID=1208366 RepID=A0A8H4U062_9HYPO|nr:hypothetical protein FSARC_5097 [Fusarium sarcochroum]